MVRPATNTSIDVWYEVHIKHVHRLLCFNKHTPPLRTYRGIRIFGVGRCRRMFAPSRAPGQDKQLIWNPRHLVTNQPMAWLGCDRDKLPLVENM